MTLCWRSRLVIWSSSIPVGLAGVSAPAALAELVPTIDPSQFSQLNTQSLPPKTPHPPIALAAGNRSGSEPSAAIAPLEWVIAADGKLEPLVWSEPESEGRPRSVTANEGSEAISPSEANRTAEIRPETVDAVDAETATETSSEGTTTDAPSDEVADTDPDFAQTTSAEDEIPEAKAPSTSDAPDAEESATEAEAEATAAAEQRLQRLIAGDRLWMQGQLAAADRLYRQAKAPDRDPDAPVEAEADRSDRPQSTSDPSQLPPAGQVYWREVEAGRESGLETRVEVPLQLLTEAHPEFIPGQLAYVEYLLERDRPADALSTLERVTSLYPDHPQLAQAHVETLAASEQWLPAAIAARQFALLNPDHPQAEEFASLAADYEGRFRSQMRGRLMRRTIGNVLAGAAGFVVTGNPFGPIAALETTVMMARGESNVGERIANRATRQLDMITDETVVAYVNELGHEMAELAGRDEFDYQFYVVQDDELNAFALPGGKIFINTGAILATETGAELAGLLAHELAHAVLSHGFQLMTSGYLTANVLQFVPYGGLATDLAVLSYSRGMERQADALGTRLLANSRYAADGLLRLMQTLDDETKGRRGLAWLSTHPDTRERIRNLDTQLNENGYDRHAFEGAERHVEIQARVRQLIAAAAEADRAPQSDSDAIADPDADPRESDPDATDADIEPVQPSSERD